MNLPDAMRTIRWMVRDTFRQSVASKLFWVMLAVTGVATLACFSIAVEGEDRGNRSSIELPLVMTKQQVVVSGFDQLVKEKKIPALPTNLDAVDPKLLELAEVIGRQKAHNDGVRIVSGEVTFAFGAIRVPLERSGEDAVRFVQVWLAAAVADTLGVLLALLWTAGFLPTFLEPQSATVLLAKPASRWAILLGKYIGVVLFVALQATAFVAATWLALGIKTGIWPVEYWLAVPLLTVSFAVFYSVSAFLAVWTHSTVASAFGVLLFWLLCWGMNYTHHRLIVFPVEGFTPASQFLSEVGYWVLPKPLDLGGIFFDAMHAENYSAKPEELKRLQASGKFYPELSVLASLAFAIVVLALAGYEFNMTDY